MRTISKLIVMAIVAQGGVVLALAAESRRVEFTYTCEIQGVASSVATVDLWMPVPSNCEGQVISRVEVVHPEGGAVDTEKQYGNRIFHRRFTGPFGPAEKFGAELVFDVERQEVALVAGAKPPAEQPSTPIDLEVYLAPNSLIPIDGKVATIVEELKLPEDDAVLAARRIYDYLIESMEYNWRAKGAGRGDVRWACDAKTGDCTDYHSTFLALCRSRGIPADHQFGFPLPTKKREGAIPFHHCWARFWSEPHGWVTVDISEADKHPELREYNFGTFSANFLRMTHGRDITLVPPQSGEPLNIFIHPYVEVDGRPHKEVKWRAAFKELESPRA